MREWSNEELERYSRHIILKDIGIEGQEKIINSKILIIGAGGLGSPIAFYLASAGVGEIGIADGDTVDTSNLQRQIIHTTSDIGVSKVESAKQKMLSINPHIKVKTYHAMISADNILDIIKPYDFVIDGTDNFATKFLINDACVLAKKPYSHGGILRFSGQTMTINPHKSACYACVFNAPPPPNVVPTCSSAGILGAVAGMLGTIQATEALKFVTNAGEPLYNALLSFEAKSMTFRKIKFDKNPKCRVCGGDGLTHLKDYEQAVCEVKNDKNS
ncbi:MAG: HesA/MoeB/ThiF family protein [Campylobacteraceae bacterium]|jgi:molybdopterin/thiamine biosynthesis adenylyltransferase|nr:HesA/MoeB/ThiF family protein [Campylobacteraceae bacterium]